jgi:hypothetical protein
MHRDAPLGAGQTLPEGHVRVGALESWTPPVRVKGLRERLGLRSGKDPLFDCLARQASNTREAAEVLVQTTTTPCSPGLMSAMERVELAGEHVAAAIEAALQKTWLVRIDREDLHQLSASLSVVRFLVLRSTRNVHALGIDVPSEPTRTLAQLIARSTTGTGHGIDALRVGDFSAVSETSRELRRIYVESRLVRDEALASIVRGDRTLEPRQAVSESLLLGDLTQTVQRCGAVGELFAWLAAKHG